MKFLNVPIDDKIFAKSKAAAARAEMPLKTWVELSLKNQLLAADLVFDPAKEAAIVIAPKPAVEPDGAPKPDPVYVPVGEQ